MSGENKGIRTFFTVITSPIWVPAAAIGGLIAAPVKAIVDSVEDAEESDNAAKGIGHFPGNLVGNVITSPFKTIKQVGEKLSGTE